MRFLHFKSSTLNTFIWQIACLSSVNIIFASNEQALEHDINLLLQENQRDSGPNKKTDYKPKGDIDREYYNSLGQGYNNCQNETREVPLRASNSNSNHESWQEKQIFVKELLVMLHEQHAKIRPTDKLDAQKKLDKTTMIDRQTSLKQLISAIGADGDIQRLVDWAEHSFHLGSLSEIATQFVVSKLGSVNCAALFSPDKEETLIPRFLLFNDLYPDVPYELSMNSTKDECTSIANFDPLKKTVVLIHGYLTGYTLVDGLTNIKSRLLNINKLVREQLDGLSVRADGKTITGDLDAIIKRHQYNVIVVDWFNGANPIPRSNYIKAAVNAQVVGQLIARFLRNLVINCGTSSNNLQIIAHSLGCHVAGFTGKAMKENGHQLGKITHLDPVGLCFGRLFSKQGFRLSPDDALDTDAIHVSLNLFDNPLDGAQANFLVNGGRDQIGCGGNSELKNSTTSSISLLFDSEAEFKPCSHLRALSLFEDDHSSRQAQCQLVGYRCSSYDSFLEGKCGSCDDMNNQCRLMSLPPVPVSFEEYSVKLKELDEISGIIDSRSASDRSDIGQSEKKDKRLDRRLSSGQRDRLIQAVDSIKGDAKSAILEGWTLLGSVSEDLKQRTITQMGKLLNRIQSHAISGLNDSILPNYPEAGFQDNNQGLVTLPLGVQIPPDGSHMGPLYYLGTDSISTYCVNYYQFRILISESRIRRLIETDKLAPNRLAHIHTTNYNRVRNHLQRFASSGKNLLHMTLKLTDSRGNFIKGFTLREDARDLKRVIDSVKVGQVTADDKYRELTLLMNTTNPEPVKISETIVSYFFHDVVMADKIEINYMSNISPRIRQRYSSVLCPTAINDKEKLVKYLEC